MTDIVVQIAQPVPSQDYLVVEIIQPVALREELQNYGFIYQFNVNGLDYEAAEVEAEQFIENIRRDKAKIDAWLAAGPVSITATLEEEEEVEPAPE